MIITVQHLYSVPDYKGGTGYCAKGSRQWFEAHGLSWSDFVRHGLHESVFLATQDALALRLVEHAHNAAQQAQESTHGG